MLTTSLGDAHHNLPIAARMLPGDQPEPGRHMPSVLKLRPIAHGSHDRCGGLGANPFDFSDTLTDLAGLEYGFDLLVEDSDAPIQIAKQIPQLADCLARHRGQFVGDVGQNFRDHAPGTRDGFTKRNSPIEQEAADLADYRGAVVYHALPRPV